MKFHWNLSFIFPICRAGKMAETRKTRKSPFRDHQNGGQRPRYTSPKDVDVSLPHGFPRLASRAADFLEIFQTDSHEIPRIEAVIFGFLFGVWLPPKKESQFGSGKLPLIPDGSRLVKTKLSLCSSLDARNVRSPQNISNEHSEWLFGIKWKVQWSLDISQLDSISGSQLKWGSLVAGRALLGLSNQGANILQNQDRIHARLLCGSSLGRPDGLIAFTEVRCHNVRNHDDFKRPIETNPAIGWDRSRKQASTYDLWESKPWPCWLSCWCWHAAMSTTSGTETLLNRTSISPCHVNPWNFLNFA